MLQKSAVNAIANAIEITLHPQPLEKGPRIFLMILVGFNFFVPILGTLLVILIDGLKFGFGVLLSVALFWGIAFYFLRKLLWGICGKEVIRITDKEIHHYFDYNLYKDNSAKLKYQTLQMGYLVTKDNPEILWIADNQLPNDTHCWLAIVVAHETFIISHETLSISDVKKIDALLRKNN